MFRGSQFVAIVTICVTFGGGTQVLGQTPTGRLETTTSARRLSVARSVAGASVRASSSIFGSVWTAKQEPVANVALRLRNVVSGRVEANAVTSAAGEFVFENVEGGNYIIEVIDANNKIVAVGQVFSVGPGETVATFVRLGTRLPWFTGMFSNAAAASVSSAAGLGVTAIAPTGRPATRTQ